MKYFLISNMYPDLSNPGYGSFVKNVVEGLSHYGIDCKYSAVIIGRPSLIFDKLFKYIKFYFCILKNYFKDYDFVYIHYPNHALPCLLPCFLLKKRRIIVNLHGEDLLYKRKGLSLLLGSLNDFFLKKVDAIVVPSNYFRNIVFERLSGNVKKVIVSPSGGIDPNKFFPKLFVKNGNSIIHLGYVGRIDPNKGWKEFIEAISLLPESLDFQVSIIGYGSEIEELRMYLSKMNSTKIEYISKVEQGNLREYYSKFDLLIFPSTRTTESLGLVGLEAMACGTPVIGSDIGGIPSYLKHKYNGFLVAPGNIKQIAEYILEYCQLDISQKELYYRNCIETSKSYFSEKVIHDLAVSFTLLI